MQQTDHSINQPTLTLMLPSWVKQQAHHLVDVKTNRWITFTGIFRQMLQVALHTNFLSDPANEYEVLVRTWSLELVDQGFLIFKEGLIGCNQYCQWLNLP